MYKLAVLLLLSINFYGECQSLIDNFVCNEKNEKTLSVKEAVIEIKTTPDTFEFISKTEESFFIDLNGKDFKSLNYSRKAYCNLRNQIVIEKIYKSFKSVDEVRVFEKIEDQISYSLYAASGLLIKKFNCTRI